MAYDYDIINSYYCSKCGTQVSGNETYCPVCGNRIDTYMYTPPPEPQPPVIQYYPPQYQAPPKVPYFGVGRAIAIIGSLLVIAAMFLPYASYDVLGYGESIHLIRSDEITDGVFILGAVLITLILFCLKSSILSFLMTVVVGGLCFFEYVSTQDMLHEMGIFAGFVDMGAGFYLMIVGAIFMAIGSVIYLFERISH